MSIMITISNGVKSAGSYQTIHLTDYSNSDSFGYLPESAAEKLKSAAKQKKNISIEIFGKTDSEIWFGVFTEETGWKRKEFYRNRGAELYQQVKGCERENLFITGLSDTELCVLLEGFLSASYKYSEYLKLKNPATVELKNVIADGLSETNTLYLNKWHDALTFTRDLVNRPNINQSAVDLATSVSAKAEETGIKTEVLNKARIESLKMGGLLAVNKGSIDPPSFTILEYKPEGAINTKPYVLVGKGIVYDTGGLSLKPTPGSMDAMKCDMAGAAAVAGAMITIAALKLPVHIIGLIPSTDNRPGGNAYAPGDVITMMDGTTVEVMNTDAEGRLILADALHYAKRYNPELVIDLATLTGAAARAVGKYAIAAMNVKAENRMVEILQSGLESGDRMVEFPMWEEYAEEIKSPIADLKNIGGAEAGMITAGKFLEHFTDYPYIHLDIAGPAFLTTAYKYHPSGGTGAGVSALVHFFKTLTGK